MEYNKIVSVTGFSGLFELIGSKNDGIIVRSLDDKTTKFIASRLHNYSHLESIEIFTESDNVNLIEILQAMDKSEENLPGEKDAAAIKKYFEIVYPQIDFTRVYASDTKKMVRWLKILKEHKIELKLGKNEAEPDVQEDKEIKAAETNDEIKETFAKKENSENKEESKIEEAEPEIKKAKKTVVKNVKEEVSQNMPKKKTVKKKAE